KRSAARLHRRSRRFGWRAKDDVARNLRRIGDPGQRHRDAELILEDLERLGDPRLAVSAEPVQIGPPDEAGARAEPEELQHVEPRPDTAVDIDLGLVAHG